MLPFPAYRSHEPRQLRQFAWLIAAALVIVVGLAGYRAGWTWSRAHGITLALAVVVLAIGRWRPELLRPPLHLWMTLGAAIGLVMNPVLLTIFFLVVLTPIGLVARAFGRRPLDLSWRAPGSYWLARDEPDEDPHLRQFTLATTRPVTPGAEDSPPAVGGSPPQRAAR
ncbi:MAG: hypothetical protein H6713_13310 [Myxococcales bacterium]|nr:hypothetical protein [Myxococcales bacterium]